jgi:hypothetical protein
MPTWEEESWPPEREQRTPIGQLFVKQTAIGRKVYAYLRRGKLTSRTWAQGSMILRIPWAFLIFSSLEKENKKKYKFFTVLGLVMCPIILHTLHIYLAWNVKHSRQESVWITKHNTIRQVPTESTRDKKAFFNNCRKIRFFAIVKLKLLSVGNFLQKLHISVPVLVPYLFSLNKACRLNATHKT